MAVSQCKKFVFAKFNVGNKLKDFSAMLGVRKGDSYVIPVSSDKTVLEMVFVESTSFMAHVPGAPVETLTEWDC